MIQATVLVQPHDCDANVFGRPAVFDQKVDHALRFDEQVATQKEDPKDHSQGEDAKDRDLDHSGDEEAPLVWEQDRRTSIAGHHCPRPIAAANQSAQVLGPVRVHPFFH